MHPPQVEPILLVVGALMAAAIVATRLSVRFGVPALVLFLGLGMLAGSEGPGGIAFEDPRTTWAVGAVALSILLYAGGLDTDAKHIMPVLAPGLVLATVGVVFSTVATGLFYATAFHRPLTEGLLLGAIVSSTDAAAVFSVLRNAGLKLKGNIQPLLELESGSNDPLAIYLTFATTAALVGEPMGVTSVLSGALKQLVLGLIGGAVGGRLLTTAINRLGVAQVALFSCFALAGGMMIFGATAVLGGSGFLAIYVAGLVVGSRGVLHGRAIVRFHDGLAWLAQIGMFVVLGLLVFPSRMLDAAPQGILITAFLLLIARPLAVWSSLSVFGVPWREQVMISWVGLRGAVPIVLACWPAVMGVPNADHLFHVVFFVVTLSVTLQGLTLPWLAKRLGVFEAPDADRLEITEARGARIIKVEVGPGADGRSLVELALPQGSLVVLLEREGEVIVPQGGTALHAGDRAEVVVNDVLEPAVREMLR